MSKVYCYFCSFEIGQVTWENKKAMKERYEDHLALNHSIAEIVKQTPWSMEKRT